MKFSIVVEDSAEDDIVDIYRDLKKNARDPQYPDRWLDEAYEEIHSLTTSPLRCSRAPEDDHFQEEIRQLICDWYKVLFTVKEQTVHVLHVRHERRDTLKPE